MYLTNQGSRKFLICGKSGGIGRPNADEVNSQCDPIAEREAVLYTKNSEKIAIFLHLCKKCCNFVAESTLEGYVLRKVFRDRFFFG